MKKLAVALLGLRLGYGSESGTVLLPGIALPRKPEETGNSL